MRRIRVVIDLSAIKNNVRQIKSKTKSCIMGVVKADGYGHGAAEVA
ncbi:MAG: alanine racemase, partial [Clostridiales bacterium]|nr:alanine racemase [Clostridiales bacterium]